MTIKKKEIKINLDEYDYFDLLMSKSVTFLNKNKEFNITISFSKRVRDNHEKDMIKLARLS